MAYNAQGSRNSLQSQLDPPSSQLTDSREPQAIQNTASGLPPRRKQRKSGAPTVAQADWDRIKDRFLELYIDEGQKLEDVRLTLEKEGFIAT